MSGRKTITVDSADYNRLRQQAARATTLTQANNALNQMNQALTNSMNQANSRINTLNSNINSLNTQLRNVQDHASKEVMALRTQLQNTIRDSNARLAEVAENNRREMNRVQENFSNALDQTRRDTAAAIAANNRHIENVIDENNRRITAAIDQSNRRIDAVSARVDDINEIITSCQNDLNRMREIAAEFTNTARMLLDDARKYRCELLLPGELKEVEDALRDALNEQAGPAINAPVAQRASRQAYESALNFHERIIQAEQEWILRHRAAQESVAQAVGRIEASRSVTQEDTQFPVDVDHWSEGDLSELADDAEDLLAMLDEETDRLTLRDLDQIRVTGQWLEHETVETTAFALGAIEASQDRVCAAQEIADILGDTNGMYTVDHGYQGNDMRGAHRIHLCNSVTGLNLVITQSRSQGANSQPGECFEVEVTDPGTSSADDVHTIVNEILCGLQDAGYPVHTVQEVPGFSSIHSGRKECEDLQRWRTETETRTRPQHTTRPGQKKT